MSNAIRDLLAERERQRSEEGWTEEHDDMHEDGSLARMAACYALVSTMLPDARTAHTGITGPHDGLVTVFQMMWPRSIDRHWFKPYTPRRDLVRAGALILAEIERLDRAAKRGARQMRFDG